MSKTLSRFVPFLILAGCTNGANPNDPSAPMTNELIGSGPFGLHPVQAANPKAVGVTVPTILPPELIQTPVAQGSNVVENPATIDLGTGTNIVIGHYGYDGDGPLMPAPGDLPSATHIVEATKTEPDKNTYLELFGQTGADPTYDYGTHFLYQGHENGVVDAKGGLVAVITRINLDADGPHRVTIMASHDRNGAPISQIDGSTWDPFAQRLIFTSEDSG